METIPDVGLVDAHVHLWDPDRVPVPWLAEFPRLNRAYLLEDYDAACGDVRVDAMVFVQCQVDPDRFLDEADWVVSLADRDPRLRGMVFWAPLERGEAARTSLEALAAKSQRVKGIRRIIEFEEDPEFAVREDFVRGVRMLSEYGLSFDLCISHAQLPVTLRLVERCTEVRFVLDHIAKPDIKAGELDPWREHIRALASFPNVVCKISGLVNEADWQQWTAEDLKPYVDHVIECFGFDRVLFGGDWPVCTLAGTWTGWVEALVWALRGCPAEDMRKLLRTNAIRAYRLDL